MSIVMIGKAVAVAAVASGALVAGVNGAHTGTDAAASPTTDQSTVACHRLRHQAPPKLRTDLRAARKLPQDQRRAAVRTIRKEARSGAYGTKVQTLLEDRRHARAQFLKTAPRLREDLRAVRSKPAGQERRAARLVVWQAALDGKYGDQVQARAEKRKEHRATCRAQHKSKQQPGTQSS